jgi:hypothetical protein
MKLFPLGAGISPAGRANAGTRAYRREQERERRKAEAAARDTANKEAERLRRLVEQTEPKGKTEPSLT